MSTPVHLEAVPSPCDVTAAVDKSVADACDAMPPEVDDGADAAKAVSTNEDVASPPADDPMQPLHSSPTLWLGILAILAVGYTLYFARALLFPLFLSIVLAALLRPGVRWMERRRIPLFVGALLSITAIAILGLFITMKLVEPAQEWIDNPAAKFREIETRLRLVKEPIRDLEEVAEKVEEATTASSVADQVDRPIRVSIEQPSLTSTVLSSTTQGLASAAVTLVLLYFLLVSGTTFQRRVVSVLPTRRSKRCAVELVRRIESGVSSYLVQISLINAALGLTIGLAMWLIGMPTPALWGVMAALFNFVPYVGALAGCAVVFFVGVLTFDSLGYATVAPLAYFMLSAIEGNFITPSLLGRSMSLNPIFVFLSLSFWGWIWGVSGAILAVPLLAMFKISCEQFDSTRHVAVLLSGDIDPDEPD